jgi:hypothetical protein
MKSDSCERELDGVSDVGGSLYKKHAAHLEAQHRGKYVIFNIEKGEYVIGVSHLEAIKAYQAEYGNAPGWCRGIGFVSRV